MSNSTSLEKKSTQQKSVKKKLNSGNTSMSGFAMFSLKDRSLLAFDERRINSPQRLKAIYGIDHIPCDTSFAQYWMAWILSISDLLSQVHLPSSNEERFWSGLNIWTGVSSFTVIGLHPNNHLVNLMSLKHLFRYSDANNL